MHEPASRSSFPIFSNTLHLLTYVGSSSFSCFLCALRSHHNDPSTSTAPTSTAPTALATFPLPRFLYAFFITPTALCPSFHPSPACQTQPAALLSDIYPLRLLTHSAATANSPHLRSLPLPLHICSAAGNPRRSLPFQPNKIASIIEACRLAHQRLQAPTEITGGDGPTAVLQAQKKQEKRRDILWPGDERRGA